MLGPPVAASSVRSIVGSSPGPGPGPHGLDAGREGSWATSPPTLSSPGFVKRRCSISKYVEGSGSSALRGLGIATILAGRAGASLPRLAAAADMFINYLVDYARAESDQCSVLRWSRSAQEPAPKRHLALGAGSLKWQLIDHLPARPSIGRRPAAAHHAFVFANGRLVGITHSKPSSRCLKMDSPPRASR